MTVLHLFSSRPTGSNAGPHHQRASLEGSASLVPVIAQDINQPGSWTGEAVNVGTAGQTREEAFRNHL